MKETNKITTAPAPHTHTIYDYHRTYGGEIYPSDFDTESNGSSHCRTGSFIASRITCDSRFDEQCLRNDETRQRIAAYMALKAGSQ